MHQNFIHGNISEALPGMARAVLLRGDEVGSRNGRTKELCHVGITLARPWQREILIPERKANIAAQIAETMWVLTGRDDVGWLRQYLPRAEDFSDDGERWRGAYGPRLRAWNQRRTEYDQPIDQWEHVLSTLKADPLSRRTTITIYDPTIDTEPGLDIPCNNWLVFTNRLGYLDLQVGIRSNDLMWGWSGINAFEWSALLEISAALLGVRVGSLHFSIASLHLYENHWPKAERLAQQYPTPEMRSLTDSPRFDAAACEEAGGFDMLADAWFRIEGMIRRWPGSSGVTEEINVFPEPMLRSWLRVLHWWWTGNHQHLKEIGGTRLEYATHVAMQPPSRETTGVSADEMAVATDALLGAGTIEDRHEEIQNLHTLTPVTDTPTEQFIAEVTALHTEKHEAYGNSWKKRGEMLGIMANIARKVDRLGGAATNDETIADTAADLMVYLFKYSAWLFDRRNDTNHSDGTEWVNARIADTARRTRLGVSDQKVVENRLREMFDELEQRVRTEDPTRNVLVDQMSTIALVLAQYLWWAPNGAIPLSMVEGVDDYRGADVD